MKTIEIEIALLEYLGVRRNIIVTGTHWGLFMGGHYIHECDILSLSTAGYASEIEIKVSRSDLLNDKNKIHGHIHSHIKTLWFAIPDKLKEIALKEIPIRAGLYVIKHIPENDYSYECYVVEIIRRAQINKNAAKWTVNETLALARLGAMRILTLKKRILFEINKNKTDGDSGERHICAHS